MRRKNKMGGIRRKLKEVYEEEEEEESWREGIKGLKRGRIRGERKGGERKRGTG